LELFIYILLMFIFFVLFRFLNVLLEVFLLQRATKWLAILTTSIRLSGILFFIYLAEGITLKRLFFVEALSYLVAILPILPILFTFLGKMPEKISVDMKEMSRRLVQFCGYNYLMQITLLISSQATDKLIFINFVPLNILAAFGFMASLTNQLQNYLPSFLLANIIQPSLMAYYSKGGSLDKLATIVDIICKLNFFLVLPVIIYIVVAGDAIISFLSDGKYQNTYSLFGLLAIQLLFWSYAQMLGILVNATEQNKELFLSTLIESVLIIPGLLVLHFNGGLVWFLMIRILGQIFRNFFLIFRLRRKNVFVRYNKGYLNLLLASVATGLLLSLVTHPAMNIYQLVLTAGATVVAFYAILIILKPFSKEERDMINNVIGRKLFVW